MQCMVTTDANAAPLRTVNPRNTVRKKMTSTRWQGDMGRRRFPCEVVEAPSCVLVVVVVAAASVALTCRCSASPASSSLEETFS
jgi:hypothetical protein